MSIKPEIWCPTGLRTRTKAIPLWVAVAVDLSVLKWKGRGGKFPVTSFYRIKFREESPQGFLNTTMRSDTKLYRLAAFLFLAQFRNDMSIGGPHVAPAEKCLAYALTNHLYTENEKGWNWVKEAADQSFEPFKVLRDSGKKLKKKLDTAKVWIDPKRYNQLHVQWLHFNSETNKNEDLDRAVVAQVLSHVWYERYGKKKLVHPGDLFDPLKHRSGPESQPTSGIVLQEPSPPPSAQVHPQPALRLLQPVKTSSGRPKFWYASRRGPVVGREEELNALRRFVRCKEPAFCWWLLTGPAGSGKTRLADALCQELATTWHAGFLVSYDKFTPEPHWQPDRPTLIVVDYAAARLQDIIRIIRSLVERTEPLQHPVRLLLTERHGSSEANWWRELQGLGEGAQRTALEGSSYRIQQRQALSIALPAMERDFLWKIIAHVLDERQYKFKPNRRESMLHDFAQLDPLGRPLFALFYAEAIAFGHPIPGRGPQALVRAVLDMEMNHWITNFGIDVPHQNLLALASMLGGAPLRDTSPGWDWNPYQNERLRPFLPASINTDWLQEMTAACRSADQSADTLASLEPDVLGELFVLDHFHPPENAGASRGRLDAFKDFAWRADPLKMVHFLRRCVDDFDWHPAINDMKKPPVEASPVFASLALSVELHRSESAASRGDHERSQQIRNEINAKAQSTPANSAARLIRDTALFNQANELFKNGKFEEVLTLLSRGLEDRDFHPLTRNLFHILHGSAVTKLPPQGPLKP